jgi:2'-5' RNA ligase
VSRKPRRKFGATQKDRIFFACVPDAETAARISALAEQLKAENTFKGTLMRPEHLHITLFHLGDWITLPIDVVKLAEQAAAQVNAAPFQVTFDRVESFRNRTGIYPYVLTSTKGASGWQPFHRTLADALKRVGLGGATQGEFEPHVTLLRDEKRARSKAIPSISWTVQDFVLIHSLLGKTEHIHLRRWPLRR